MSITELIARFEALDVLLWEDEGQLHFRAPPGTLTEERKALLRSHKDELLAYLAAAASTVAVAADPQHRHDPFPLTDVQASYLVGRGNAYACGGIGCHGYVELALPDLDPHSLERAWHQVILRHDMLRAIIDKDGSQRVLNTVILPDLVVMDLRTTPADQTCQVLEQVRQEMATRCYEPDVWPLYELRLSRTAQGSRLHLSLDMLVADFVSAQIILSELDRLYHEPECELPQPAVTFRDVVLATRSARQMPQERAAYEKDRAYWLERIQYMPGPPDLPVLGDVQDNIPVRFRRVERVIESDVWQSFCRFAGAKRVTSTGAVLAAFSETLGLWSRRAAFCLNVTVLNRPPVHPDIYKVVGDFTAINVLEVNTGAPGSFTERAQCTQRQLWDDLAHSRFSGIEVLRETARQQQANVMIPVVFTSTLGINENGTMDGEFMRGARLSYGITQTPQVWLDCQVSERSGALHVNWDVREGIFPEGVVEDAFTAFADLLNALAADESVWHDVAPLSLPSHSARRRTAVNNTAGPIPDGSLLTGFLYRVSEQPEAPAVIDQHGVCSYLALARQAAAVAQALSASGMPAGGRVAIAMEKSIAQIAAVIGVLWAGGVYLPIDLNQPQARRDTMLVDADVRLILVDEREMASAWPADCVCIAADRLEPLHDIRRTPVARIDPQQLAYVIYTSGTTGAPKGVMMSHCAALNTIADINQRFQIRIDDRVLGLANLAFDLSVYDIFGLLTAGGALVLPDPAQQGNPAHWAELIRIHRITLWNAVPAQMQMLQSYLKTEPGASPDALRLVLLSGDWIPTGLPGEIRGRCPGARIISLGGATEAGIWSIYYDIVDIPADAHSIPYGTPLANQRFYILNSQMRQCPDRVTGEIYIAGAGLALGYLNNREQTQAHFVHHPDSGERLYRTGDLGRYRCDGVIELLGRDDSQVKIRGHRIELGEIESVLQRCPGVAMAAAVVHGDSPVEKKITAFVEPSACAEPLQEAERSRWAQAVCRAGNASVAGLDGASFSQWVACADQIARLDMLRALRQFGLFPHAGSVHSLDEIIAQGRVAAGYHRLLQRWLRTLCEAGWLEREPSGVAWRLLREPPEEKASLLWAQLERLEQKIHYSEKLLGFLRTSSQHLPELLRGEVDPLTLLFPQGKLDIALAAYNDNLVNSCMNAAVCAAVRQFALTRTTVNDALRPLRVLEIGAGVGGTSRALIPVLADFSVDYFYSDISPFFLNEARQQYSAYPWVRYGLLDINQDYISQGFTAGNWDVIVCANVLHNAKNAPAVLSQLRELCAPGGTMIVIEATKEIPALMTSMEFEIGLSGFTDERADSNQTFFTDEQWRRMFTAAGGDLVCVYPPVSDALSCIGQMTFVIHFPQTRAILHDAVLRHHLEQRLPGYMLPGVIECLQQMPLSRNGKVDRDILRRRAQLAGQSAATNVSVEQPSDDLEVRIAAIWASMLGREHLGRHEDFFLAGGDSLLIAQVVAKMRTELPEAKAWEWDRLMREILLSPSVAATAMALRSDPGSNDTPKAQRRQVSALSSLAAGRHDAAPVHVVLHDGSGTLSPYRALLPLLSADPRRRGEILGFSVPDAEGYLARDPEHLIEQLACEYAALLLEKGLSHVHLIGYCMGGLLATEIGRLLLEAGITLDPVTVISSDRFRYRIDDDLLLERAFGGLMGADIAAAGHTVDNDQLAGVLKSLSARYGKHFPAGCLLDLPEEWRSVSACYRQLGARPASERLAALAATVSTKAWDIADSQIEGLFHIFRHSLRAVASYQPEPFAGDLHLLHDDNVLHFLPGLQPDMKTFWTDLAIGDLRMERIEGDHLSCLHPPYVQHVATRILQPWEA
ncbi:amino acid adenylation domain-containing protein [Affinibrenneria salicis]|uniref:Amino acid adenylation domain-containing protein n=1 Tax=Affinibrenneria salicis TaxID=2590031 RepID=A0A5J5FT02_9GAMM|nr:non-ribosomal peptide synthetase [Affinibrenneria salicis]KAA8996660.1 amino acid adenylation domain-containing protein [Affinibrenneria salicis]